MDIYLTSITIFIVLTIIYFIVLKPTLTLDKLPEIVTDSSGNTSIKMD